MQVDHAVEIQCAAKALLHLMKVKVTNKLTLAGKRSPPLTELTLIHRRTVGQTNLKRQPVSKIQIGEIRTSAPSADPLPQVMMPSLRSTTNWEFSVETSVTWGHWAVHQAALHQEQLCWMSMKLWPVSLQVKLGRLMKKLGTAYRFLWVGLWRWKLQALLSIGCFPVTSTEDGIHGMRASAIWKAAKKPEKCGVMSLILNAYFGMKWGCWGLSFALTKH